MTTRDEASPGIGRGTWPGAGRRRFLAGGAALLGVAAVSAALGCSDDDSPADGAADLRDDRTDGTTATTATAGGAGPDTAVPAALTAADFAGLAPCLLMPEQTEGPF